MKQLRIDVSMKVTNGIFRDIDSVYRKFALMLIVGVCFYLGAKLGLMLATPPDYIATFWPPNTIILSALLISSKKNWWIFLMAMTPAYFFAAIQADYSVQRSIIFF